MTLAAYTPPTSMPPYINFSVTECGMVRVIMRSEPKNGEYGNFAEMLIPKEEMEHLCKSILGNLQ